MTGRFLVIGTLVCALVLFVWQTISNTALPWHMQTMRQFANDTAAAQAVRAQAPANGVYFSPRGMLVVASMDSAMTDQSRTTMGVRIARQFALDVVAAVALVMLLTPFAALGPMRAGTAAMLGAFAVSAVIELSNWNWYGFTLPYALVNVVDQTIGFFLAGLALGAVGRRLALPALLPAPGVRAEGALPPTPAGRREPTTF